ncbi:hypothetical protein ABW19_dt0204202 [Dactylella cylindrospora]|nr:hypothetical protein ABW19_dt0204202 [Dactylella cylindrospora]
MADQAAPAPAPESSRPRGGGERGNRGRGRGGGNRRGGRGSADLTNENGRPIDSESRRGRGGRGRGGERGGRGGQFRGNQGHSQQPRDANESSAPVASTMEAATNNAPAEAKDGSSDEENEDICFICANPIQYHSIAPCNHMTCHICALRMRALYKTKQCPHCRTESDFVIFTTSSTKTFEEYTQKDIAAQDEALGIKYEEKQIRADTLVLLRYNCPEPSCDVACLGWPDLHRHVKNTHHLFLCDLCSRFKKVFTHEHTLFTAAALRKHERHGDDVPGAEDQSGFKGHPECEFCRKRFYGDDELYAHCKEAHERCFICDRDTSRRPQYFVDWSALEQHFKDEHHRCTDPECLEKKFIVFASEMDLQAHLLEEHPNRLSKEALKSMRKVDMASFPDAHSHSGPSTSRGRGGRMQRDYRRDPQAPEPPPPDGPMRRDEIAYQRTLAVQSAQTTVPQRMFGGQLTRPAENAIPVTRPTQPAAAPAITPSGPTPRAPVRQPDAFPPLASLNISSSSASAGPAAPRNPPAATPAVAPLPSPRPNIPTNVSASITQKHEAVISRATRLLNSDASKLEKFKKYISNYNAEQMSAKDLIEAFWVLFDVRATDLATLLRELSELFEKEDKRSALLGAWNEWKSVNEDYPPMPGGSGATAAGSATSGARVLKLKSATNRNLHAGASPWSSVTSSTISRGAGSLANINGGAPSVTTVGKGKAPITPWAAAARNTNTAVGPSSVAAARAGRPTAAVSAMEFPSLPKVVPKHPPVARKNEGAAPASVWGAGGAPNGGGDYVDDGDVEVVRTKGKGKKKQTIIQWG